jgi:polysaccharide export outer membrane protein
MAVGPSVAVLRDIEALYETGTAGGLTDRQLLERFMFERDRSAEAAFEMLVCRHGPMVLRVCHNVLGDATDAQDAFQATFLVLVRRCRTIRQLESIGGWLYGVACRVAARARVEAARRRAAERRGGLRIVEAVENGQVVDHGDGEFGLVVQEEVRRLPENYRAVVALCYWEGLTQEQAAAQLGCPLGTVRSRMARARKILHRRLTRRGAAPLAGIVAAALGGSSGQAAAIATARLRTAIPAQFVHSTVKAAVQVAGGRALAEPAAALVSTLTQHVLRSMKMIKICKLIGACCVVSLVVIGVSLWAQQPRDQRPRPRIGARPETSDRELPKSAQQRIGPALVVEPPDLLLVEVLEATPGRPISGERLVRPDGSISLGFYGDIHVAGLTLPEVKEKIVLHLRKYISDITLGLVDLDENGEERIDPVTKEPKLLDPRDSATVFVDVTAYNSQVYYVEGDVAILGRMPVTGGETVLDAIHFAGGLLPSADQSKIRLIRSYPKGSPVQVLPINYEEVTMGTDSSTNYQILPNDRLVVPRDPAYLSRNSAGANNQQRSAPSSSGRESAYFPGLNTDTDGKELESLRAVERHLKEVEEKLDKLIETMGRAPGPGPRKRAERVGQGGTGQPKNRNPFAED